MCIFKYLAEHFPDRDPANLTIWDTGAFNFHDVWPNAIEVTSNYGEDFSPDGYDWAIWKHFRLYQVWRTRQKHCPVWRCKHCGFWCDVWDYYPMEIHVLVKCDQVHFIS